MNFTQEKDPKKHMWGIGLVVALHAIVIWALLTGLAQKIVEVVKAPLETMIIQEIKSPPPPPFIPPPEVVVATPPPTETIQVTTAVVPQVVERMVPTAPPDPASTAPVNTPRAAEPVKSEPQRTEPTKLACEEPEYPPTSRRNEEQGTVVLRFLIDVNGHVVDSKIVTSSGFSRLDRAAKDAFSLCTFKPATEDGTPIQRWAVVPYKWQLQ